MVSPANGPPSSNELAQIEAALNRLPAFQCLSVKVCHSHQTLKFFIEGAEVLNKKRYCQLQRQALRQDN